MSALPFQDSDSIKRDRPTAQVNKRGLLGVQMNGTRLEQKMTRQSHMSLWAEVLSKSRTTPLRETVRKYIPNKIKIDKPVRQLYSSHWPNIMGEILMTELKATKSGVYYVSSVVKLNVLQHLIP